MFICYSYWEHLEYNPNFINEVFVQLKLDVIRGLLVIRLIGLQQGFQHFKGFMGMPCHGLQGRVVHRFVSCKKAVLVRFGAPEV